MLMPGSHPQMSDLSGYVLDVVKAPWIILNVKPGLRSADSAVRGKVEMRIVLCLDL